MKKRLAFILGGVSAGWLVWVFLLTLPVLADGGPHRKAAGTAGSLGGGCYNCHRAHTAQAPDLLKEEEPALCYSCHGEAAIGAGTNVEGGVYFASHSDLQPPGRSGDIGALRGGGFVKSAIDTKTADAVWRPRYSWANNHTTKVYDQGDPSTQIPLIPAISFATVDHTYPQVASLPTDFTAYPSGAIVLLTTDKALYRSTGSAWTTAVADVAARKATTSWHAVDPAHDGALTMWGNGAIDSGAGLAMDNVTVTMSCTNCHDPHGNGNFRILRPVPIGGAALDSTKYPVFKPDGTTPLYGDKPTTIADDTSSSGWTKYVTTNYWNVAATGGSTGADGFATKISSWCSTCHTRYLAPAGAYKTDSGDDIFKFRHATDTINASYVPNCVQCHLAHGSPADMARYSSTAPTTPIANDASLFPWPGQTETHDPNKLNFGDSRLLRLDQRGVCAMCHYR